MPPVVMLVEVAALPPLVGVTKSPFAACVDPNFTEEVAVERAPEAGHVPVSQKWLPVILTVVPVAAEVGVFESVRGITLKLQLPDDFPSELLVSTILPV